MIEGKGSKDHQKTKVFMASMPESFELLFSKIDIPFPLIVLAITAFGKSDDLFSNDLFI